MIKDKFANVIAKYPIVGFDMFDTLVVRPFFKPRDIFYLCNEEARKIVNDKSFSFVNYRIDLENESRNYYQKKNIENEEVSLDEFYQYAKIFHKFDSKTIEKLKQLEINTELNLIRYRKSAHKLFYSALALNKKIIVVSDMYFSGEIIRKLLSTCGYKNGSYELFLSSEIGYSKSSGRLYEHVLKELKCKGRDIVFFGDNYQNDVVIAKDYGINAYHFPKTTHHFNDDSRQAKLWQGVIDKVSYETRSLVGVAANKLFDDPEAQYDKNSLFNGNPYNFGYYAMGPALLGLVDWILKDITTRSVDLILFLARDGFLPIKAYNLLKEYYPDAPHAKYFYCSRQSLIPLFLQKPNNLTEILKMYMHNGYTISNFFRTRFDETFVTNYRRLLSKYGIDDINLPAQDFIPHIAELIYENHDLILNILSHKIGNTKNYIDIMTTGCDKIAVYDVGLRGRSQQFLLSEIPNISMGYYLITDPSIFSRLDSREVKSYLDQDFSFYKKEYLHYTIFFEAFFSSFEPQCIGYDMDSKPVLDTGRVSNISEEYLHIVKEVQKAAMDFVRDYSLIFKRSIRSMKINKEGALHVFHQNWNFCALTDFNIFDKYKLASDITYNDDIELTYFWDAGRELYEASQRNKLHKFIIHKKESYKNKHPNSYFVRMLYRGFKNLMNDFRC